MKKFFFLIIISFLFTACSIETIDTEEYPLYFSIMIHMEEDFKDDKDVAVFEKHVQQLNMAMDLADDYDAKITIETEIPFASAVKNSGSDILTNALERGNGVGTHCGSAMDTSSIAALTESYLKRKELVDSLVGKENNRGCSGGWGESDSVLAAQEAGFSYLDGIVYLAYLAQDQSIRPNQVTDEEIREIYYHDPVIPEFSDHIYPRFVKNAEDFIEDEEGTFVLLNGALGEIGSLAEDRKTCGTKCKLTKEDLEFIYDKITDANKIRDKERVTHLFIHLPLKYYSEENEEILRSFFAHMQELQKRGEIQWGTQGEVYDTKVSERK